MCVDEDQKWSPGWYFPSTTSQGFGHPQGMVWAVSYKQYQRPTAGPLCFSRPLVLTLAVPLFLLMVVRGRRAGPAANRCSVIGIAVYVRVPTRVPKSTLVEVHRTGEPKRQQHGTRERSKFPPCSWVQISAQPLSSDVKSGKSLISLNPSIFICWVGSRVRIILSTSEIIKCIWST